MFPVFLDVARLRILFVGQGEVARNRLKQLRDFGAENIVFYDKLPSPQVMVEAQIVMVAGLESDEARRIADMARSMGKLVNVEDDIPYCDFFYGSTVQRGDLTIAVGTNGKSPTLARTFRMYFEHLFDEHWGDWLANIARAREEWREAGVDLETIGQNTEALIVQANMQPLADFLNLPRE